jgi:hypothetical protein
VLPDVTLVVTTFDSRFMLELDFSISCSATSLPSAVSIASADASLSSSSPKQAKGSLFDDMCSEIKVR